ncbi:hypothetical protein C0389_01485 [bacterium]|nr:hypothetical protein [bacterium]
MKKIYIVLAVILTILISILPFIMYATWVFQPKKKLQLAIIDKTVLTIDGNEHKSLNWILTNDKYCTLERQLYSVSDDYYGFFPQKDKKYAVRDFENFDSLMLKKFVDKTDAIFMTDTYGLYKKEWFGSNLRSEYSPLIYGGTSQKEINLLKMMKAEHKLIISEFNTIASPTTMNIRVQFEAMFGLKWTGWVGRYFDNLDTTINKELPVWVIRDYKNQHNNIWPFTRAGIVFVKETGRLEILEYKRDLTDGLPQIISNSINQKRFGIPQKLKYSYWFDVMKTKRSNNVVSVYQIFCNARGDSLLKSMDIPNPFPAVIEHYDKDSKFYYFCGDFSDNPVESFLSRFYGISNFKWIFFSKNDPAERESFFWSYYQPLVHRILNNYQNELKK